MLPSLPTAVADHHVPMLVTVGGLRLGEYTIVKPLLLLTYLVLHGPATRAELAGLLWPHSRTPRNCVRVALCHLRRRGVGIHTSGELVSAAHPCDVTSPHVTSAAVFLEGVELAAVSDTFEEWVFEQRDRYAARLQGALLRGAARHGGAERQRVLWRAWRVPGAPSPCGATLARFLSLCEAGSALHRAVEWELADLAGPWAAGHTHPFVQAVLAGWLEGGVLWLTGDAAELTRHVACAQAVLTGAGQQVLELVLPPGASLDRELTLLCGAAPAHSLTVCVTVTEGDPGCGDLLQTLARWPDVHFIVVGGDAPPTAAELALHCPGNAAAVPRHRTARHRPTGRSARLTQVATVGVRRRPAPPTGRAPPRSAAAMLRSGRARCGTCPGPTLGT
ncbi:hypothetical protein [uncultured Deinococcus sp.]|uniref:hypothetical protein n=1 Tax=uncultured Deinococcus sp. TaxID=158789 RepID=UPI0025D2B7A7|nr:hypothetical protein [uncultured Deinococcus sp.]